MGHPDGGDRLDVTLGLETVVILECAARGKLATRRRYSDRAGDHQTGRNEEGDGGPSQLRS